MAVFFIVSIVTYRYFDINERGLLSIFWATFFFIELFIIEFGVTVQAKIPDQIIRKAKFETQNTIFSSYIIRALSAFIIGFFIFIFSEKLALIIAPSSIDYLRLDFVLKAASLFFICNVLFGPIDHSILIGFQKYEKMKLFYNMKIAPLLISALLTLALKETPEFMILSYMIIRLVLQFWIGWSSYFLLKKSNDFSLIGIKINFTYIIYICKHGFPIWISSLLAASLPHIAILILAQTSNLESIAQYSLAMSLFMAGIAFLSMLDGWLVPKLSEQKSYSKIDIYNYLDTYFKMYFYASSLFAILLILLSQVGVKIIAGSGYEESVILLIVLCCFMNFRTLTIFRNVIVVFSSTNIIPIYVVCKFIIEIIIMLLAVPKFGFYGILIAQFISFLFIGQLWVSRTLSSVFNIKKISKLFFSKYFYMCSLSSLLISVLLYLFVSGYSLLFYSLSILFLVSCIILIFKNKENFKKILAI
ncbi:hypothetical protein N9Z34_03875 [Gammaproteobacteria bacterium]|nr:hypothetical protein [Gammaproteobacteria bacterium]